MYVSRWQTFIGAVLLLLSGKLGWVEMSHITRYFTLYWTHNGPLWGQQSGTVSPSVMIGLVQLKYFTFSAYSTDVWKLKDLNINFLILKYHSFC